MGQAQEVLLVEIFQVAVVVLQQQVFVELVVDATVVKLVNKLACVVVGATVGASNRQAFVVAGVTTLGVFDLAAGEGQVLELAGGDLTTLKGLRQHATVVGHDDRQFWLQGTNAQFSLGNLGFSSQAQAGEIVHSVVAVAWEYRATGVQASRVTVLGSAGVQLDAQQANRIHTKTYSALGKARGEVQLKALTPFSGVVGVFRRTRITVIVVDIEVTQLQRGLAVFNEASSACLLRQQTYGHSEGQGGLVHGVAPMRF